MSRVYCVGDLHFGHKNICAFRGNLVGKIPVTTEEEHREAIILLWNQRITKRDTVLVLGDAVFTEDTIESISRLKGTKVLVRGNHDVLNASTYLTVFKDVAGMIRSKAAWLTHAPIHPQELRGKINIHGHVHNATINDRRYRNVSLENTIPSGPVLLEDLLHNPEKVLRTIGKVVSPDVVYGEVRM